jgi:ATP-dependent DNA helicase RecG
MNLQELNELVTQGESERLEFKRSTGQLVPGAQTVCALLNGTGGFVLFGVNDRGEVVGQEVVARTVEEITQALRRIEPPSFPDIETVPLESGRSVIALRVSKGGSGPYTYDGRPYVRQGPTTSVMPRERYEQLLIERMHATRRWENQAAEGLTIDDLDYQEVILTVGEAIRRQRLEDPGTRDAAELLLGLGLIREGQILNAAVVLFGRSDRLLPNYPQCLLRMARFRGPDKTEFADNRQQVGNAFSLLKRAQSFLIDHLPVAGRIVPGVIERVDEPLYPSEALREALANAFCHRDYSIPGGAVSVAIYDDRLEITSTGRLPFDMTADDLTRPHASRPWNPLVAQTFYRRGIIESWGRGTLKMAELTERAGLVPPEFEATGAEVLVRFRPLRYVPPTRVNRDLSALQQEILKILADNGPQSLGEIRFKLSKRTARRTVQDNLRSLRVLDLVDNSGRGAGAKWGLKGNK